MLTFSERFICPLGATMKLSEAIAHFGSKAELARALGIEPQAVYQWPTADNPEHIPEGRQYQIQALTDGVLKADPKQSSAA